MKNRHSQRATNALQKLAEKDPAFASLSLWAHHRDAEEIDTIQIATDENYVPVIKRVKKDFAAAYTDGSTVWYGDQFTKWTLQQQYSVCAHELCHIAWRHPSKAKDMRNRLGASFDMDLFNIAADAIINEYLRAAGYILPTPCFFLTELLYEVFDEGKMIIPSNRSQVLQSASNTLQQYTVEKLYFRLKNSSAATNRSLGWVEDTSHDQNNQSNADLVKDYALAHGYSPDFDISEQSGAEKINDDNEWQQRFQRAINIGNRIGRGIGQINFFIAEFQQTMTPWEFLLRRVINKAVARHKSLTFNHPHTQWLAMHEHARLTNGLEIAFQPGYDTQSGRPKVLIGDDNSMSITDDMRQLFASEIASIARKTGAEIHLAIFDTIVHSCIKLDDANIEHELRQSKFKRGGGTNFIPVMEKAKDINPSIIIMLTDLLADFGDSPANKKIPVIWATPLSNPPEPPYGRVIQINK